MSMSDPIADLLTRIRNGVRARHPKVDIPHSRTKEAIAHILKQEGFLDAVAVVRPKEGFPILRLSLRYLPGGQPVVSGLQRVSRPGRRFYCSKNDIPAVLGGLGVAIVSTSRGVMSGESCRQVGVGGEVLCNVW